VVETWLLFQQVHDLPVGDTAVRVTVGGDPGTGGYVVQSVVVACSLAFPAVSIHRRTQHDLGHIDLVEIGLHPVQVVVLDLAIATRGGDGQQVVRVDTENTRTRDSLPSHVASPLITVCTCLLVSPAENVNTPSRAS
jgi:hypothetical protein